MPSVRLEKYFPEMIIPMLPSPENLTAYWKALSSFFEDPKNLLITRKFREFSSRGKVYTEAGRDFVVSDNETALWVYMRCKQGLSIEDALDGLKLMKAPIAFAFKKGERDLATWKKAGRKDQEFSNGGWKHCHLLQCSPQQENITLLQRCYRLMTPFNHFPFPSPRRYAMTRDWGEDQDVLNWITAFLAFEHYSGVAGKAFLDFIDKAGGECPTQNHLENQIQIEFEPKNVPVQDLFSNRLNDIDPSRETHRYVNTDERISSFERGQEFDTYEAFIKALRAWLKDTDEDTIGNAPFGMTPWVRFKSGTHHFVLNSDTTREGVAQFLKNHDDGNHLKLRLTSRAGSYKKLTNDRDGQIISGFYFYRSEPDTQGQDYEYLKRS